MYADRRANLIGFPARVSSGEISLLELIEVYNRHVGVFGFECADDLIAFTEI
jgi:hypothetical protein